MKRALIAILAVAVLNQSLAFAGFSYDTLNRLTGKDADAAHPSLALAHAPAKYAYTYNPLGQRLTATAFNAANATLYTETLAYDSRNRPTSRTTSNGTLSYTYDAQSNLASVHSNDLTAGVDVTYAHDALNRLAQAAVRDPVDGTRKATNYGYDSVGNLDAVALPNNVTSIYAYDALNRLQTLTVDRVGTLLASYTYTVDASGHRTSVTELNNRQHSYAYDSLYRLTTETITTGTGDPAIGGTIAYTLDKVGNRLSRASSVPGVPSASQSYDANDRLTSDTYDANGNTKLGIPANGAVLTSGDIYDFENRLIQRSSSLNAQLSTINLLYDCDGNRVSETIGAQVLTFLVDTMNPTGYAQVVEERVNGTLLRTYAYGHALLSQTRASLSTNWTTTYYAYDGHGSTRLLTDALGAVTDTYAYDAFGVQIASTSASATPTFNRYRYVGEQHDDDLGLIYLRARYMNPASGRFWSMDSYEGFASDPQSLHKYLYANADPIGRIDPSGFLSRLDYALIGQWVHRYIGLDFVRGNPKSRRSDTPLYLIMQDFDPEAVIEEAIRPDLVDTDTREAYEIKPNRSGNGASRALNQLNRYIETLRECFQTSE